MILIDAKFRMAMIKRVDIGASCTVLHDLPQWLSPLLIGGWLKRWATFELDEITGPGIQMILFVNNLKLL
jgi:hypothetical protein